MNLRKQVVALAIIGAAGLFAAAVASDISPLVQKINGAKDAEERSNLMKELNASLNAMNDKDSEEAQAIIDKELKPIETSN
jgi:hypothetical protein